MSQPRKNRAEAYSTYFGDMDLTEEEKEARIKLAEDLDDVFFFLFSLILLQKDTNADFDEESLDASTIQRYKDALVRYGYDLNRANDYLNGYVEENVPEIVQTTLKNVEDPFYLSQDRAQLIAENEANAVRNYTNYKQAIKDGYTKKKWMTKKDRNVRHTHMLCDGEVIGIKDEFEVGACKMLYPKDVLNGTVEETANCRCVLKFLEKGSSEPQDVRENTSSIDEMHIGTTDDMLHIGSVDNDYLHVGTVDDMLHIGAVTDLLHVKAKVDVMQKILDKLQDDVFENLKISLKYVKDFSPEELREKLEADGYKVIDLEDGGFRVESGVLSYLEYHPNNGNPYYIIHTPLDGTIMFDMEGNEITN